ncbi:MAG: GIY-YIG nuclease family protein, partial [Candidatus Paceibacterota bacterium]
MNSQAFNKAKLPDSPGVYFFRKGNKILYIGKATSLKDRVKSYFANDLIATRGPLLVDMVFNADKIAFEQTDSVLEALILEAELIKKYQPKYNTKEKDNKSFNYIVLTKEKFPRVLIERGRNLEMIEDKEFKIQNKFGPFTNNTQLKEAVKIIRKIFPFRDRCLTFIALDTHSTIRTRSRSYRAMGKPCFNYQIGLCPGVCVGLITEKEYSKIIKNIKLFFEGKKKQIIKKLEKEMLAFAKAREFEKADKIKRTIFALNHIQDVALIKNESLSGKRLNFDEEKDLRIEAYDVAHISGEANVGVMVVLENGEPAKNEYRKFKIKESKQNDVAGLKEILKRRLTHGEWSFPQIIVVDGGKAQIRIAREVLKKFDLDIHVVSVLKNEFHKPKAVLGEKIISSKYSDQILLANSEAHRFAIKYHRSLRDKVI